MNRDGTFNKKLRLKQICNLLLILINSSISIFLCIQIQSRNAFEEISKSVYPNEGPLMKSYFIEIFFRKEFAVIIALLIVGMITKEFFIKSLQKKLVINLCLLFFFVFFSCSFAYLLYLPILDAHNL